MILNNSTKKNKTKCSDTRIHNKIYKFLEEICESLFNKHTVFMCVCNYEQRGCVCSLDHISESQVVQLESQML